MKSVSSRELSHAVPGSKGGGGWVVWEWAVVAQRATNNAKIKSGSRERVRAWPPQGPSA